MTQWMSFDVKLVRDDIERRSLIEMPAARFCRGTPGNWPVSEINRFLYGTLTKPKIGYLFRILKKTCDKFEPLFLASPHTTAAEREAYGPARDFLKSFRGEPAWTDIICACLQLTEVVDETDTRLDELAVDRFDPFHDISHELQMYLHQIVYFDYIWKPKPAR